VSVDVAVQAEIARPRAAVAAFAGDPTNAPTWYANIDAVEWLTEPPLRVGSRMAFVARFLGRRLEYTYEVVEVVPDRRLVMRTSQGPFPMETIYEWGDAGTDRTLMRLQNRGNPTGFSRLAAPLVAHAMRRAMTADLALLSRVLEDGPGSSRR
jgi:uncharacterized membrane protein